MCTKENDDILVLMFCLLVYFKQSKTAKILHVLFLIFIQIWDKYFYFQYVEIEVQRVKLR